MKTLCDHIDGTTTFICMMTTALIHYSLLSNDVSVMSKDYKLLEPYTDSPMIKKTTVEERAETSCLILSIVSYLIINRPDLLYHSRYFFISIHKLRLLREYLNKTLAECFDLLLKMEDSILLPTILTGK